jgi:hypothetical protein
LGPAIGFAVAILLPFFGVPLLTVFASEAMVMFLNGNKQIFSPHGKINSGSFFTAIHL